MPSRPLVLAGLAAALAAPLAGIVYLWRRPLPVIQGNLRLAALRAPVEIIRDRWGVPHIYAQNDDDLFFAQGFVHAQDRLWQMELNRRIPAGRLAEIVGEFAYSTDRLLRILGVYRAAENDYARLSENGQRILERYARGVNTFLDTHFNKLPLEFTLLRFAPEPWRPQDSLAWAKMMSWGQGLNWDAELLRAAILDKLGPERAARLLAQDLSDANPIILNHTPIAGLDRLRSEFHAARPWLDLIAPMGMSNNWVVDGAKSATGKPLLANDPHLPLQIPSIWYEAHLHSPELQAAGATLPGAPTIILGHNAEIGWGATNGFADVQDLYIERFDPADPTHYEVNGEWRAATVRREEIRVKGVPQPRTLDVIVTRHGPIINEWFESEARDSDGTRPALALRWQGYEPARLLDAAYALNRAHDWNEFQESLRLWDEPALSFVYADRAGNIGYYLAGRVPQRRRGKGATPVPGWNDDYEWTGWIPFEELPHTYNPPEHFIATANNAVVGAEYGYHLSLDTMNGFRAKRIVDSLTAQDQVSADDYARIQTDVYCEPARTFLQILRALRDPIAKHAALSRRVRTAGDALDTLTGWDCQLTPDSVGGALYQVTLHYTMVRLFEPWLGDLTETFIGVGLHPLLHPVNSAYLDRAYLIALRILQNQETEWLRDAAGNTRTCVEILARALADALAFLEKTLGADMAKWQWGKLHRAAFHHALGGVKPLDRIFNRGPFPYGGDTSTVWQGAFVPQLPIPEGAVFTASWRQILDVSDWDASRGVHAPGQSGHPASRHYADLIPLWLEGKHHPLLWSREKILANREGLVVLEPV